MKNDWGLTNLDKLSPHFTKAAWIRPSDWLPLPVLTAGQQRAVGLFAVYNSDSNFLALNVAGDFTVDWGDGVTENFSSGYAYHNYVYTDLSSGTLSSRGYRQAVVSITPQAGQNLTSLRFGYKHNQAGLIAHSTGWLDIAVVGEYVATCLMYQSGGSFSRILEHFTFVGPNAITSVNSMFRTCTSLVKVSALSLPNGVTDFSNMFNGCIQLSSIPVLNTASATNMSYMFNGCPSIETIPMMDTSSVQDFGSMFAGCSSLKEIPALSMASSTACNSMFATCYALQRITLAGTAAVTSFSTTFNECRALAVATIDATGATSLGSVFGACISLREVIPTGAKVSISVASCCLSRAAIVALFNALASGVTGQTVTVSGNWGAASLTADDLLIATAKGWTVAS